MNHAVARTPAVLVRPAWQRLAQIPVRGQKLRWRDARTFRQMTEALALAVTKGRANG